MAATRALTITDVYDRFVKGKKVKAEDWDYKVIPENLTALKQKYNLSFRDLEKISINAMKSAFIHHDEKIRIIYDVIKKGYNELRAEYGIE